MKRKQRRLLSQEVNEELAYYCLRCKRIVELKADHHGVRCPYCGYRALRKERPSVLVKKVKAV